MLFRSSATLRASEERGRSWMAAAKRAGVMGSEDMCEGSLRYAGGYY